MEKVIRKIESELKDPKLSKRFGDEYPRSRSISKRADRMMRRVRVDASNNSSVISIHAESKYPEIAALVANKFVEAYEEYIRKKKETEVTESINALKAIIDEQRSSVNEASRALSQYKKKKGIYTLSREDEASLDKATLNLYLSELPVVEKEVSDIEIPYYRYKADYDKLCAMDSSEDEFLNLLPSEILQSKVKSEYDELRQRLENLRQTRGERHPKVREAIDGLNLKKEAIAKEYEQFMSNLEREYILAVRKRDDYLQKIESFNQERETQDETAAELSDLQTRLETATRIYNALQEKSKELGALKGIEGGDFISLIDKAYVPNSPAKPNKLLNVFLGLIVGITGGLGMAFFQEHLDNTIKSQEDIEEFLEVPLLGTIPLMKRSNNSSVRKEMVVVSEPKSLAAEAFKTVRTGLFFASRNSDLKTMLVTSGAPSEGKTIFAVNLALTIAQSGSKTLLIDADIRKPRVHRILQLNNQYGLTSYLSSAGGIIRTQKCAEDKNLYVITSGPVKSNPTELLGSPRMKNLMEEARKKFDKIIIDTPPVMTVSDSLILTGISDGIIQVINFGKSNKRFQLKAKNKINSFGGKIVGAVLNRVDFEKNGSGHYYQNYYYSSSTS
jgi:capsular exopolysaccharide synthesis family protein